VLGEILSQHLEKSLDAPVDRKFSIGDTTLTHQAFQAGEIDLYPEYTGTALVAILKLDPLMEPTVVLERCRQEYRGRMAAEWMEPLGFNNSFAIVVRAEDARAKHLATISDAAAAEGGWRLGTGFEFQTRNDGLSNLNRNYRIRWAQAPRVMGLSMLYGALEDKSIDMAAGNMTDGPLNSPGTTILKDNKNTFPPYEAAVVVRHDALATFPGLRESLAKLSGRINEETMRRLNFEVDGKRREPAKVAGEWLASAGL
jgi:glycine betaine/choline ABC-type transport system substrate-binding protein